MSVSSFCSSELDPDYTLTIEVLALWSVAKMCEMLLQIYARHTAKDANVLCEMPPGHRRQWKLLSCFSTVNHSFLEFT